MVDTEQPHHHLGSGHKVALGKGAAVAQLVGKKPAGRGSFPAKAGLVSGPYPEAGWVNAGFDGWILGAGVLGLAFSEGSEYASVFKTAFNKEELATAEENSEIAGVPTTP